MSTSDDSDGRIQDVFVTEHAGCFRDSMVILGVTDLTVQVFFTTFVLVNRLSICRICNLLICR